MVTDITAARRYLVRRATDPAMDFDKPLVVSSEVAAELRKILGPAKDEGATWCEDTTESDDAMVAAFEERCDAEGEYADHRFWL